jgi:hypothetical protein
MSLSEITAAMAALQKKEAPLVYFLCGRNVYRGLLRNLVAAPAEHALNTAQSSAELPGTSLATILLGVRVVSTDLVDPNFWQVLPDPAFFWRGP